MSEKQKRKHVIRGVIAAVSAAALLTGCASITPEDETNGSTGSTGSTGSELDQLIAAAQAEGLLTFYAANPQAGANYLAEQFATTYGIPVTSLSLPGGTLSQRWASEAEAGTFTADTILGAAWDGPVADTFVANGWMIPIRDAGIPAIDDGSFPSEFLGEATATVGYNPWTIAYNTDAISDAEAPKTFADLADPKYKGRMCQADPNVALAYIELWIHVADTYGPEILEAIAANEPRYYPGGAAAAAALAAGECDVVGPTSGTITQPLIEQGAPVGVVLPESTIGTAMQLAFIKPELIANPNAQKLFAQFVLSPQGNEAQAVYGENIWVLDPSWTVDRLLALQAPPGAAERVGEILGLLGL